METIDGKEYLTRMEIMSLTGMSGGVFDALVRKARPQFIMKERSNMKLYRAQWAQKLRKRDAENKSGKIARMKEKYKNGIPEGEIERWINGVFNRE